MARNKKKTQTKSQNNKGKSGNGQSMIQQVVKAALPLLMKAASAALTGIPFPTSGARAVATPQGGSALQVAAPAANGAVVKTTKASMRTTNQGISVTHREYITDVVHTDPNVFEILLRENVNPTNPILFPWLSSIASRFETFRFEKLRFVYEPQCGTQALGTVMLAVDYDALDDPPIDKTQLMAYKNAVRSPAWFACVNESDRSDLSKSPNYYTVSSGLGDERLTNVGKLLLCFQSESDAYTAGELYVEYTVKLDTPQLQDDTDSRQFTFNELTAPWGNTDPTVQKVTGRLAVDYFSNNGGDLAGLQFHVTGTFLVVVIIATDSFTPLNTTSYTRTNFSSFVGSSIQFIEFSRDGTPGDILYQATGNYNRGSGSLAAVAAVYVPVPEEILTVQTTGSVSSASSMFFNEQIFVVRCSPELSIFSTLIPTSSESSLARAMRLLGKRAQLTRATDSLPVLRSRPSSQMSKASSSSSHSQVKDDKDEDNAL